MTPDITGLVLTYNGERLLADCLASLSFCNHVVVVDSCSTDATVAIARQAGATIVQRAWTGPADQFDFALKYIDEHYPSDWIVSLDQDEICTVALRESLLRAVQDNRESAQGQLAGFWIPRRSWYYDRFLKHSGWYPDYLLRCFRRGRMQVSVSGAHYSFHPLGETKKLSGDILHYPYSSFYEHLEKINSYAQQGAESLAAKGRKGGLGRAVLHGIGRFIRLYVLKKGFLDGRAGFINAVHGAFYAFLKYVRVDEGFWGKPYNHK